MNFTEVNYSNFNKQHLSELLRLSINGDSEAYAKLSGYVRHISFTYFLSKHRLGKITNKDDVEDLANNVYLSFAEQYHKIENIEFWLRRVLFLNFVNWYKKNNQRRTFELDEAYYLKDTSPNPGINIDAEKVLEFINEMSLEKQQILKMRFWEELKFAEIAENMKKSEDAVKKMFYRAIEELKGKL